MKLIKTTAPGSQGTSTIIDKDGITITQSGSDEAYIQSDTPFYKRDGKYAYEVTLISITNKTYGGSFGLIYKYPDSVMVQGCASSKIFLGYNGRKTESLDGGITFNNGDVVGLCWDLANTTLEIFINGAINKKIDLKAVLSPYLDFSNASDWPKLYPVVYFNPIDVSNATAKVNFGQEPHKYTYDGYIDPYYEIIPDSGLNSLKQY